MTTTMKFAIGIHIAKSISREMYTKKLLKRYREVKNLNEVYEADIKYLVDMLNRNEIRLEEFDLIALTSIHQKS